MARKKRKAEKHFVADQRYEESGDYQRNGFDSERSETDDDSSVIRQSARTRLFDADEYPPAKRMRGNESDTLKELTNYCSPVHSSGHSPYNHTDDQQTSQTEPHNFFSASATRADHSTCTQDLSNTNGMASKQRLDDSSRYGDTVSRKETGTSTSARFTVLPLAYNPHGSLLELTYKLKVANAKVLGSGKVLPSNGGILDILDRRNRFELDAHFSAIKHISYRGCQTDWGDRSESFRSDGQSRSAESAWRIETRYPRERWPETDPAELSSPNLKYVSDMSETQSPYFNNTMYPGANVFSPSLASVALNETKTSLRSMLERSNNENYANKPGDLANSDAHFSVRNETPKRPRNTLPKKYKCSTCTYQTDYRSHLRRHESTVHGGLKMYICFVCMKEFSRSEKVKDHMLQQHPEVDYHPKGARKSSFIQYVAACYPGYLKNILENGGADLIPDSEKCGGRPRFVAQSVLQSVVQSVVQSVTQSAVNSQQHSTTEAAEGTPRKGVSDMSPNSSRLEGGGMGDSSTTGANGAGDPENSNTVISVDGEKFSGANLGSSDLSSSIALAYCLKQSPFGRSNEKRSKCPQCDYAGRDIWHLRRHIADVHTKSKNFRCRVCNYSTSRKHRLVSHMKSHGKLFCMYCDFSTPNLDEFNTHLRLCAAENKAYTLTCDTCEQSFPNRKLLHDHMINKHNTYLFFCDFCSYYTQETQDLNDHLQIHGSDPKHFCTVCNASFDSQELLQEHQCHVPTAVKPEEQFFKCSQCPYQTSSKETLQFHQKSHSQETLACRFAGCYYTTTVAKRMARHIDSYHNMAEVKTYQCPKCRFRPPFKYKRSFEKHLRSHDEDDDDEPDHNYATRQRACSGGGTSWESTPQPTAAEHPDYSRIPLSTPRPTVGNGNHHAGDDMTSAFTSQRIAANHRDDNVTSMYTSQRIAADRDDDIVTSFPDTRERCTNE